MTASAVLRWGVLGTAGINHDVVPAIRAADGCEVVAIASRTPERARLEADALGLPRSYGSYEALLADPEIDAIYLSLPNFLHLEWVLAAVAAGKHVLCEKPMAITARDAQQMVDAARFAGVLLAEAFMYEHHPRYDRLHAIVAAGEIGDVRSISGTFTFDASEEMGLSAFAGHPGSGAVYDVGCYVVHAARRLLRTEPQAVTASAQVSIPHGDIDMMTSALVEFPGDVSLLLQCGMWAADEDSLRILGSTGRIEVPSAFFCAAGSGGFVVHTRSGARTETVADVTHYAMQAQQFAAGVLQGATLRYPDDDPVRGAAVLDSLTRSWQTRERVLVDPGSGGAR
ncbi:MAG: Gfo/Idh/MocA family oxidoreductase [Sporichthyaceae bacterium]